MRALTVAGYLILVVGTVVLELTARRDTSRLPSLGDVVSTLSSRRAGRVAVIVGWWWVGWHFFVR
jgi:Family of unknown function (DUF6186)